MVTTTTLTYKKRIVLRRSIPFTPVLETPKKTSKKTVRFSDDNLEQVVYFYKTLPSKSINDENQISAHDYSLSRPNWPSKTRVLYNDQDSKIRMEHVELADGDYDTSKGFLLEGRCRALNISYQKLVSVRYTFDLWSTFEETVGLFKESIPSTSNTWDRFSFSIPIQPKAQTIYLALKYTVNGQDYWDNNNGSNYQLILTPPQKEEPKLPKPSLSKRYDFSASLTAAASLPPSPPITPPIDQYTSPIFIQEKPVRPEMSYTDFVNKYCFYNSHSNLLYSTSPSAVFT
ncbi:unnamed protein product [Rhizopus stolonifer]